MFNRGKCVPHPWAIARQITQRAIDKAFKVGDIFLDRANKVWNQSHLMHTSDIYFQPNYYKTHGRNLLGRHDEVVIYVIYVFCVLAICIYLFAVEIQKT